VLADNPAVTLPWVSQPWCNWSSPPFSSSFSAWPWSRRFQIG